MTSDGLELVAWARWLPQRRWRRDGAHAYVKAGIMLDDLVAEEMRSGTLFEEGDERRSRLMAAIDAINDRHGRLSVVPAVQGFRRDWRIRADNRSPAWTTRTAEVPVVTA